MRRLAAALVVLALTAVQADQKPQPAAGVQGRVAGPDGKPIAGAAVLVLTDRGGLPVFVQTGEDGTFSLAGLAGSRFRVHVAASDLAPFVAKEVPAGASLSVTLKPGVARSGRVLDLATHEPVAGATIAARQPEALAFGEAALQRVKSGEDGRFTFPHLPPGDFAIEAWSPRHARSSLANFASRPRQQGEAGTEEATEPTLYLGPGGNLAGRVVGSDGKPVAGATVHVRALGETLLRPDGGNPPVARSDAQGRFTFEGLPAETPFRLTARREGFSEATTRPVTLTRGEARTELEMRLESAAALTFRLVDPDDNPVSYVTVSLATARAMAREVDENKIESAGDGTFRVAGLDAGTFEVTILPEAADEIVKKDVKLAAGETVDFGTLRVVPGLRISGRVLDRAGGPVAGAKIRAFWIDGTTPRSRVAKSRPDGGYRVGGLPEGLVQQLSVTAEGFARSMREGVAPGDTAADFTLDRNASIIGRVVAADGSVPPSFRVEAKPEAEVQGGLFGSRNAAGHWGEPFTDPAGNFRLDDVSPGRMTVVASAPGHTPARKTGVSLAAEEVKDLGTLTLGTGRTLRGRVVDAANDTPVAGAAVAASLSQAQPYSVQDDESPAVSANDGRFEIAGLEARTYQIAVLHADFARGEASVEVPADADPAEITLRLGRGGGLTGTVRDVARTPVADARIILSPAVRGTDVRTATTGTDGRYAFERVPPGSYTAMRLPDDRRSMIGAGTKPVQIREGETATLDFEDASKHQVSGRVLRGSQPVDEVNLFFMPGDPGPGVALKGTTSDAEGKYTIGLDAPGRYTVETSRGVMYAGATVQVVVPDLPASTVDIVLESGTIPGRVVDPEGKPVAGAFLLARREAPGATDDTEGSGLAQSGADGSFTIEGVADGTYRVVASGQGYPSAEAYPVLVSAERPTTPVELRLEKGRTLRGRVLDPRGNPIRGAFAFYGPGGVTQVTQGPDVTDVNGSFALAVPASGSFDVVAHATGFAPAVARGVSPPDEDDGTPVVTLALRLGGRARVQAQLQEGGPAVGAAVQVRAQSPLLGSEMAQFMNAPLPTGADGTTLVSGLPAGAHVVRLTLGTRSAEVSAVVPEDGEVAVRVTLP